MFKEMSLREKLTLLFAVTMMGFLIAQEHGQFFTIGDVTLGVLCLCAYVPLSYKIIIEAFKGLIKTRRLNEQILMVIATFGAFGIHDYAEALAVMVFYMIGEAFEKYAQGKSRGEITSLIKLKPQSVRVINDDGGEEIIKPRNVKVGQKIRILKGESVALDGVLLTEHADIDTSALTGESEPRVYQKGDEIPSGCINTGRVIELKVSCDHRNSSITRLLNLIEDAAANKSRPEALIRRFANWYTPLVVAGAVLLALIPLFVAEASWSDWGTRALVFLVVSCPCALVLSVPLSFFGGMGAVSKIGIMVKGTVFIENLAKLKAMAFDKTGTITKGDFTVSKIKSLNGADENEVLRVAAALEKFSTHPLATAVVDAAQQRGLVIPELSNPQEQAGLGLCGEIDGNKVVIGRYELASRECSEKIERNQSFGTDIYVLKNKRLLGILELFDEPKKGASEALVELQKLGISTCLITGDKQSAAQKVAADLKISEVLAEQLPEDKLKNFEKFKSKYGLAAFVGDGINDAPVLAASDVGIAMGQFGSQAAVEAADVVVMTDDLTKIPRAIELSRKTYALAMQNLWFSVVVKFVILFLGAFGVAGIWMAIFGDVGVLILAVLNAMRSLTFVKVKEYSFHSQKAENEKIE